VLKISQGLLNKRWAWIILTLLLTIGLFVVSTVAWFWYSDKQAAIARQSSLDLLWMEQVITQNLESHHSMLTDWGQDLQLTSPKTQATFSSRIEGLLKENHALLAIEFIDSNNKRVVGLPNYSERPNELPPISDPLIAEALQRSQAQKSASYSRVIEQYAPLWVLVVPIIHEGIYDGAILATYDLDKLLTQEVPWWFVQRYDLRLVDKNDKLLTPRDAGVQPTDNVNRLGFGPANSGLSLKASPRSVEYTNKLLISLAIAIIVFGLLIMWLLQLLRRRLKDRQAAQQAMRQRDELLQHTARLSSLAEFASGIAHELNQPLAAITNYSAAAESFSTTEPPQWHRVQHALGKMGEEARRAGNIMRSMRSFIQKSSSPHEPHLFNDILQESERLVRNQARRLQIEINITSNTESLILECDAVMLKQVIFNLLRNAIESMQEVSRENQQLGIQIYAQAENQTLIVSIIDHGTGIADVSKLFQAFYTTKNEGMGLGLAICRTVIETHGGKLWAENNLPSVGGATFHFKIPCVSITEKSSQ
jgi:signal transduction histidine kinase